MPTEVTDEDRSAARAALDQQAESLGGEGRFAWQRGYALDVAAECHAVQRERADKAEAAQEGMRRRLAERATESEHRLTLAKKNGERWETVAAERDQARERVTELEAELQTAKQRIQQLDTPTHLQSNEGYDDGDG